MSEHGDDVERLAVDICSHSGRHTASDGDHNAEKWGPCSQCKHYARVVEPMLAEVAARAWDEGRVEALREAADALDSAGHHWSGPIAHCYFDAANRLRKLAEATDHDDQEPTTPQEDT